jgi:hypothetical protein
VFAKYALSGVSFDVKLVRGLSVFLCTAICAVMFFGCTGNSLSGSATNIQAEVPYTLLEIRPGEFYYPGTTDPVLINHPGNTMIYAYFNADFSRMIMALAYGEIKQIEFLITNVSFRNGNIRGTMSRIHNGRVVHYRLYSDRNHIYVDANVLYSVNVDQNFAWGNNTVNLNRDKLVLVFSRGGQ